MDKKLEVTVTHTSSFFSNTSDLESHVFGGKQNLVIQMKTIIKSYSMHLTEKV